MSKEETLSNTNELPTVDLIGLISKVVANRKFIFKVCGIAAIVGVIIAFSIPRQYETKVVLIPETTQKNNLGNMGALAAMAGFNLGGTNSDDAISPELYPELISSLPFLVDLFDTRVSTLDGEIETTLYDYMDNHQKRSWIGYVVSAPFKVLGWIISLFKDREEEEEEGEFVNIFRLTMDQTKIAKSIDKSIISEVDVMTGILSVAVRMQDPLISAVIADSVASNLQKYVTDYRTNKARQDLMFSEKLYKEAERDYHKSQQKYAAHVDGNMNIVSARYKTELDLLKNQMDMDYNIYNQLAQQLQLAKVKVQEITPVYTVLQPVTVPLKAASPNKPVILILSVFFAFLISLGWIFAKDIIKSKK